MQSGKSLELQVKRLLEEEISRGELPLDPAHTKVFHKRSYYSYKRKGDITFDVVIEVTRPGATEPFLIWIWECKDLAGLVEVGDVEEFASKIEQIGVHGAKGSIASRMGFQSGAIEFAKSNKLGLVTIPPDGTVMIHLQEARRQSTVESFDCEGLSTSGEWVKRFSDLVKIEMAKV